MLPYIYIEQILTTVNNKWSLPSAESVTACTQQDRHDDGGNSPDGGLDDGEE